MSDFKVSDLASVQMGLEPPPFQQSDCEPLWYLRKVGKGEVSVVTQPDHLGTYLTPLPVITAWQIVGDGFDPPKLTEHMDLSVLESRSITGRMGYWFMGVGEMSSTQAEAVRELATVLSTAISGQVLSPFDVETIITLTKLHCDAHGLEPVSPRSLGQPVRRYRNVIALAPV